MLNKNKIKEEKLRLSDINTVLSSMVTNLAIKNEPFIKDEEDSKSQSKIETFALNKLTQPLWQKVFGYLLLPSQLNTLKLVSRNWKSIVESIPYLKLNDGLQRPPNKTVIAIPPVNSSGDIYHLLAFSILSMHGGYQIPKILLSHDSVPNADINPVQCKVNTGDQVRRALNFVKLLGFEEWFGSLKIPFTSGQPAPRQSNLESGLKTRGVTHYIDNRASTSIISDFIRESGLKYTTTVLRMGFSNWNIGFLGAAPQKLIDVYVNQQLKMVQDLFSRDQRPIVVFHYRYSDKANSDQDLSSFTSGISDAIKDRFNIVGIYADSRRQGYNDLKNVKVNIRPFQQSHLVSKDLDLGKLAHLKLLSRLFDLKDSVRLQGVIGNTSGTLDLVAFLGHRVFNIHNFSNPFDYQDYRLMIQSTFLTLQDALEASITDKKPNVLVNNVLEWLNGSVQPNKLLPLAIPKKFVGISRKGFSFLFSVCDLQQFERWVPQEFVNGLEEFTNSKLKSSGFLKSDFNPSKGL